MILFFSLRGIENRQKNSYQETKIQIIMMTSTYIMRMWELIHWMQAYNLMYFCDVPSHVIDEIKERFSDSAEEQLLLEYPQHDYIVN